jgi:hypothetical protein
MELKKIFSSVEIQSFMLHMLSMLPIPLQIQYNLNLKIRNDSNHHSHISSVYEMYLHIRHSGVDPYEVLAELIVKNSH